MKVYTVKGTPKIFLNSTGILSIILGLVMVSLLPSSADASLKYWISALGMILFGLVGIYTFNKMTIIIDTDKIEVRLPLRKDRVLYWNEVKEVISGYFLYPETGGITLIPKSNLGKKPIHVSIGAMPIELIKNILSHLPPDTKVELYPYLKRKLEGKQTWFYIK